MNEFEESIEVTRNSLTFWREVLKRDDMNSEKVKDRSILKRDSGIERIIDQVGNY